jgi:phage shock protein E
MNMSLMGFFKKQMNPFYISQMDALKLINENKNVVLLDVRTQEEYNEYRIKGAMLMDIRFIENQMQHIFPDTSLTYILYCRSGVRSNHACMILKNMGYNYVFDLGGIIDWPYGVIQ